MQPSKLGVIEQPIDHALQVWSALASSITRPPPKLSPSSSPNSIALRPAAVIRILTTLDPLPTSHHHLALSS
jgi:hypothetical protein